ncbi:hypothetical protein V1477_002188 [Vespula maculifrons]|uniref:Uncharacterized protein n=1 Tax=Vespula maculifrons TaxID=7453 RepID=A0ABD2CVT0_VESMC
MVYADRLVPYVERTIRKGVRQNVQQMLRTKGHKWKQIRFAGALFSNLQDGKRSTYQERDLPLLIPEEKKEVTLATSRIRET